MVCTSDLKPEGKEIKEKKKNILAIYFASCHQNIKHQPAFSPHAAFQMEIEWQATVYISIWCFS